MLSSLLMRGRVPLRATSSLAWTAAVPTAHLLHRAVAPWPHAPMRLRQRYTQTWARGLLACLGAEMVVHPSRPEPFDGPRLVVSNHRSLLDIPVMLSLFGGMFLSRGDLAEWPIIGWAARQGGTLFVDRSSAESRSGAVQTIRREIARGHTITVFPEGTTYQGDEVRRFAKGAFGAVQGLGVPIIPVGIAHPYGSEFIEESFLAHAANVARRDKNMVAVAVGSPIQGEDEPEELARRARDEVQQLVTVARACL